MLSTALGGVISAELAHDALRDLAALPAFPVLHVCGDVRAIAEELLILPFAALDIENTRIANLAAFHPDQLAFATLTLGVGVVDTQDTAVEPIATIRGRIQAALERIEPERLWLSPDCGLRALPPDSARAKLANLAEAVNDLRATL
jgi:5-methyltetrahydropteroyltriglutamate--homocysteine methyltransferase